MNRHLDLARRRPHPGEVGAARATAKTTASCDACCLECCGGFPRRHRGARAQKASTVPSSGGLDRLQGRTHPTMQHPRAAARLAWSGGGGGSPAKVVVYSSSATAEARQRTSPQMAYPRQNLQGVEVRSSLHAVRWVSAPC
ncbi:hypothetical protein Q4I32_002906 [Leishmania shawi]|uniref:Uncharacterized protein n=1 Tax=Leishmania shawi TaxID=5680 RepID=A0AAW3C0B5_9TRYP